MSKQFSFSSAPVLKRRRSFFDLSHGAPTTMSVGKLYPILVQEVYPGDTFKIDANIVLQSTSAFIKPVIDNLEAEVRYFYVPNRTVSLWERIMGENKSSAWAPSNPTYAPRITEYTGLLPDLAGKVVEEGDVLERLGWALGTAYGGSAIPVRGFAKIYDEWYRDQNNIAPMNIQKGLEMAGSNGDEKVNHKDWSPSNYTGKLPNVARFRDYFTTALPSPQKGDAVDVFEGSSNRFLPVGSYRLDNSSASTQSLLPGYADAKSMLTALGLTPSSTVPTYAPYGVMGSIAPGSGVIDNATNGFSPSFGGLGSNYNGVLARASVDNTTPDGGYSFTNLVAYDPALPAVSVNELRYAVALQRMLEVDAIGGTRYAETLLSHWGVMAPDQRLNRSEYLGGRKFPISITQVAQTSETSGSNYLGGLGAYSLTNAKSGMLKGFVEHGFIFGLMCIRQKHMYSQGMERFWFRRNRVDFYDPVFANIGYQPIYKKELFVNTPDINADDSPFGYGEAWQDLRFRPSRVTGQLRPDANTSLDVWTFADDYANAPSLNALFIEETPEFVDRALQVPSTSLDQFVVDIWFNEYAYRVLPTYSTPGMLGV